MRQAGNEPDQRAVETVDLAGHRVHGHLFLTDLVARSLETGCRTYSFPYTTRSTYPTSGPITRQRVSKAARRMQAVRWLARAQVLANASERSFRSRVAMRAAGFDLHPP